MKFAVCGTGEYLSKGIEYLKAHGYEPLLLPDPDDAPADTKLLICLAHPEILKQPTISRFQKGCLNFHCGLPNYRGRHPLQWMLIDGVDRIPVAVHYMDEGIDTGDIVSHDEIQVDRNETYASALEKVTAMVGPLLVEALNRIELDAVHPVKQVGGRYTRKRTPEDSKFSFDMPSAAVHRFINAMADPMPNAFDEDGNTYWRSDIGHFPGQIVALTTDGRYVVATADGVVLVALA